jgi:K+-transporting ATPase KdpF subunit
VSPVPEGVRKDLTAMIYLTVVIAAFLLVYLFVAMIRPEWF